MNLQEHSDVISGTQMDVDDFFSKDYFFKSLRQIQDEDLSNSYGQIPDNGFTENQIFDLVSEHPIGLGTPRRSPSLT